MELKEIQAKIKTIIETYQKISHFFPEHITLNDNEYQIAVDHYKSTKIKVLDNVIELHKESEMRKAGHEKRPNK